MIYSNSPRARPLRPSVWPRNEKRSRMIPMSGRHPDCTKSPVPNRGTEALTRISWTTSAPRSRRRLCSTGQKKACLITKPRITRRPRNKPTTSILLRALYIFVVKYNFLSGIEPTASKMHPADGTPFLPSTRTPRLKPKTWRSTRQGSNRKHIGNTFRGKDLQEYILRFKHLPCRSVA